MRISGWPAKIESTFEDELRTAPGSVILTLVALGVFCVAFSHLPRDPARQLGMLQLALVSYAGAAGLALVARWHEQVAAWGAAATLASLVHLAAILLREPVLLALLGPSILLSIYLVGMRGAALLALAETSIALAIPRIVAPGPSRSPLWVALVAMWGTLGLSGVLYRTAQHLWVQTLRVSVLLEEARERRAELAQALEDWAHVSRQLALANERISALRLVAEEAQKTKAAFVARVSHEFRTPLNMIIGLVGLMVEKPEVYAEELLPELMEDLRIVYRNCQHLASMVTDVLDLSQAEAGRLVLHREWVDLSDVVQEAIGVVKPLMDKKRLLLQVHTAEALPPVYCDRTRIRQVILNLLSNAARFTTRGRITLSAALRDGHVVISVADTGPGIAPEDAAHVFESFYQGGVNPALARGGSGLGLTISKQFVELHGGRVWLESELGVGTTFSFELPVSPPAARPAGSARWIREDWRWREDAFRTDRAGLARQPRRPGVVVYDETGELRSGLERYAEEVDYRLAVSAEQAVVNVREFPPYALLINTATTERLLMLIDRLQLELPDTLVVGSVIRSRLERAAEAGVAGYLMKPVARTDLLAAIGRLGQKVQRVLVVDDDADFLRLVQRMLEASDDEIEVTTASSGGAALETMRAARPDLVLLDIKMPDLDGWEVLRLKSQEEAIRDVPVIFVTAQDPAERLPATPLLVTSVADGFTVSRLLRCALEMATVVTQPDGARGPAPG